MKFLFNWHNDSWLYTFFSGFSQEHILVSLGLCWFARSTEKSLCCAKAFQWSENRMTDVTVKEICDGRVMLISGEQFDCEPLVWCDMFAIIYAQLEGSSPFSPWEYPSSSFFCQLKYIRF